MLKLRVVIEGRTGIGFTEERPAFMKIRTFLFSEKRSGNRPVEEGDRSIGRCHPKISSTAGRLAAKYFSGH
jgi:hypothetical protein